MLEEIKISQKGNNHESVIVVEPLPQGYGMTLGNALRRVLLSSLPGSAITQVKIPGVPHEYSTIKGVKEDVVEILLNLKKVRLKIEGDKPGQQRRHSSARFSAPLAPEPMQHDRGAMRCAPDHEHPACSVP